jgi:hypothetical protein
MVAWYQVRVEYDPCQFRYHSALHPRYRYLRCERVSICHRPPFWRGPGPPNKQPHFPRLIPLLFHMGGDANVKWKKSEQRQRLVILGSLIGLSVICLLVVTLLSPHPTTPMTTRMGQKNVNNYGKQSQVLPSSLDIVTNNAVANTASPMAKKSHSLREQKKKKEALVDEGGGVNDVNNPLLLLADDTQREEKEVAADRAFLEAQVRAIKKTGVIMEADKKSLEMTGKLQDVTRKLLKLRYGDFGSKNYRVELTLEFQPSIPDFKDKGKAGSIVVELAPISLLPCSVYNFLEIARTWKIRSLSSQCWTCPPGSCTKRCHSVYAIPGV